MKLLLLIIFSSFQCLAQEPSGAIELPEHNILYRGYPNKVIPAATNNLNREVILFGSPNVTIIKQPDSETYIVKPGKGKVASLYIGLVNGDSTDTIRTVRYRVVNLPDPTLYWSGIKDGAKANIRSKKLFAKYPPSIPLNATFNILDWEILHNGERTHGKGSNLSSAEDLFKEIKEETEILITTTVVGPDGVQRKITGVWKVKPWGETEEPRVMIIQCSG
ncbi:MAG: hypothetical protein AB8B56_00075 [Crocinitomicaceae bacterium]